MASRSRTLTDHNEIRRWAEKRNARPSTVRDTGRVQVNRRKAA